ncbi:Protein-serine/threonine kinase [Mycena sanguinolenta]|uniref:Protein-serine/threonine kinase n=1 Tax=Mycena sanguinolenta TaxID=230812 RepID=A0A8H6YBJ6_9AGAR|nr:Protein-serine/threonine kinase [Mycena sanguinolenta]
MVTSPFQHVQHRQTFPAMSPPMQDGRRGSFLTSAQNKQLELYAAKEANRLTLRQLIFFGRSMDEDRLIKVGPIQSTTEYATELQVKSANYVRTELPVRIAHRLRDMQKLPFIVVTQEGVAKVYDLYWTAFEKFRRYPPIVTLQDNIAFCRFLTNILHEHSTVIPTLALGLSLSSPHLSPDDLDSFMRRMLVSRISRRVLAEHHIALSEIRSGKQTTNGEPQAMRATASHKRNASTLPLPSIRVTIVAGANDVGIRISDQGGGLFHTMVKTPSDLFSFSHLRNAARLQNSRIGALRTLSSSPLGMRATVDEQVDRWQQTLASGNFPNDDVTDPEMEAGVGPHPRIGIGLPMSNIFATYFGGSLELVTMDGWGTDVYLRLPKLGTNLEGIEV